MKDKSLYKSCLRDELSMFMEFCKTSYSENTCREYQSRMHSFDDYLVSIDFDNSYLSEDVITGWFSAKKDSRPRTLEGNLTTLRGFLLFRKGLGKQSYIPPARKKTDDYTPYIFSDKEIAEICRIADEYTVFPHNHLPYIQLELPMVIRILCGCGTRLGETLAIRMSDVDFDHDVLTLRTTKWNKERYVPMHPDLGEMLRKYCMAMKLIGKPDACLFPRHDFSEPLEQFDMRNRFNVILKQAGITLEGRTFQERGPCMHCFRHGFVFRAFKQLETDGIRVDDAVPILSVYLGHFDLTETEKYMKFSSQLFPEELARFEDFSDGFFPEFDEEELI